MTVFFFLRYMRYASLQYLLQYIVNPLTFWTFNTDVQLSNGKKKEEMENLNFCTVLFSFLWHCFEKKKMKYAKSCIPVNIV